MQNLFRLNLNPFFDTPDSGGGEESTVDLLLANEPENEEVLDLSDKTGTEENAEEESQEEEEEEIEIAEEESALVTPVSGKAIVAKYPEFFKDFPFVRVAMAQSKQYSEMFGTIEDAKDIKDKGEAFDNFTQQALSGNTENILKGIKDDNPEGFKSLVDNYLTTLGKVDIEAHNHVVGNVLKNTISLMARSAKTHDNEALLEAAKILNKFVFETDEFVPAKPLSSGKKQEDPVQREQQEYQQQRLQDSVTDLTGKVQNVLKATISQNIDPKGSMNDYTKRAATRDAFEATEKALQTDPQFRQYLDRLWANAIKDNLSRQSVDKIRSVILSKAKTILMTTIPKARQQALKGLGKSSNKENKGLIKPGRTAASTPAKSSKSLKEQAKELPKDMSTADFLLQD